MDLSAAIGFREAINSAGVDRQPEPNLLAPRVSEVESDDRLLQKVEQGDKEALSALFRLYATTVRNIGNRVLRDKAEADDLVQDVFLYIYRKSALFDGSKGAG